MPKQPEINYEISLNNGVKITPELAATVVRDFILPMFENDGRKLLRKRGSRVGSTDNNLADLIGSSNTVF